MTTATINAGELRHRVAIQALSSSYDSRGQNNGTWSTSTTVWGNIETLDGRELEHARKIYANASHRVTIRYMSASTLTNKNRFLFGSRVLNIGHINKVDQVSEALVVLCSEDK